MLAKRWYPDDLRTVVVVDFIDQMNEHHEPDSLCHFRNSGTAHWVIETKASMILQFIDSYQNRTVYRA